MKGYYKNKICLDCSKSYIGGTNSKRCKKCNRIYNHKADLARNQARYRLGVIKEKCYFCNSKDLLHVHHTDFNSLNNNINNLLVLCQKCHNKIHKIYGNRITSKSIAQ